MEETTLDLRDIYKILKKRRKLIFNCFMTCVVAAIMISLIIPPTYEATTTLRIKQPKGFGASLLSDLPVGNGNAKQLMSTYAEILKSRTVVESVINQTQADKEEPPTYEDMLKIITTLPVKDTEILNVKVTAKSPEEAELVANTLVNTFIDRMTYLSRSEQSTVREFIGERLQDSKQELEQAETALEAYKRDQKIVAPADETKAMVEKLAQIDQAAAENTVNLAAAQATLASSARQIDQEKPGFVADSPLIQQYKSKLAELEVELVSLSQNYTDKHPKIQATRAAVAETQSKLNAEIGRILTADAASVNPIHQGLVQTKIQSEAQIAVAAAKDQAIKQILGQSEQQLMQLPAKEQGLAKVMRDASVAQEIYIMLAKRHEEARISEVMQPTDVQVIDTAIAAKDPIKPRKALNVAIAAILGLFLGVGLAFLLEFMYKTINTPEDVEQYLGLPVIGKIPDFDADAKLESPTLLSKLKQAFSAHKPTHHG